MTSKASRTIEYVPVTTMGSGHRVELAVHRLSSGKPGPTIVLFGGIHGDEATGVEAVRRIVEAIEIDRLIGTVVAVPVCNPYAYETMTRHTVQDGLNLNRIFPGDRNGSLTEQLAAVLTGIQEEADFFIDYHSSGLYSTVDYAYVHKEGQAMAEAYGTPVLYHHEPYPGSSTEMALTTGVPAMVSELGGGGQRTVEFLDRAVAGTLNVLRTVGILEGAVVPLSKPQKVLKTLTTLRPTKGGILLSNYTPDSLLHEVPRGTVLGKVVNAHNFEVEEELVAPFEPTIVVLTREEFTRIEPGDYGFMVGDGDTTSSLEEVFAS
ncbi:hypothetical protein AL755_21200 [Arthrobacter sp. ERGS1:01]|uniref:succinylglutamate desuccinylase/aspartoacylase family protein n=1 Tax=Arthrobacter sp. ERGS1:01 TaxID=1704044 RepID=UPI0006B5F294|nr:M14 family metallopeptidase [Arthrobacter sp. ERGS1:01]ALE07411.1 hypothetical protein AL755_21200 [Arthrobacter sp. ERGS1:01]